MIKQYEKNGKKFYKFRNIYIGIDPLTGKEIRKSKSGFKTKREAEIYISKLRTEYDNNNYINSTDITFKELYQMWYESYKDTVKPSSLYVTQNVLQHILEYFGNVKVKKITTLFCQKYLNKNKDFSYSHVKKLKSYTSLILKYAVKMQIIQFNPMDNATIPKRNEKTRSEDTLYYTKDELKQFLEIVDSYNNIEWKVLFRLLAFTGARKGEILALTWNDINFSENTIDINKTLASTKTAVVIQTPKSKSSIRNVSIDTETARLLRLWKLKQREEFFKLGIIPKTKQLVFCNSQNGFKWIFFPNYTLKKICDQHNFKLIKIHGFRHTHASLLFESGNMSIKAVQHRLGHSDIQTTMNIYTHVTQLQKDNLGNDFAKYMEM